MPQNLAARNTEERAKVNVDLAASGVAYKERLNLPVISAEAERQAAGGAARILQGKAAVLSGSCPAVLTGNLQSIRKN